MPGAAILSRFSFAALAAAAVVGCPGTLEDPGRFTDGGAAACPDIVQTVFLPTCAMATCHTTMTMAQGLDLQAPNPATRLVGVATTEGNGGFLIDPNDPSASAIYTKLLSPPPFGSRMPFGKAPLDPATIACVLSWVEAQVGGDAGTPSEDGSSSGADDATTSSSGSSSGSSASSSSSSSSGSSSSSSSGASSSSSSSSSSGGSRPDASSSGSSSSSSGGIDDAAVDTGSGDAQGADATSE